MAAFDTLTFVTFVADAGTPPEDIPLVGKTVGLPPGAVPAVGEAGVLMGVPGSMRSGPSGLEWLMAAAVPVPVGQPPAWAQAIADDIALIKQGIQRILHKLGN